MLNHRIQFFIVTVHSNFRGEDPAAIILVGNDTFEHTAALKAGIVIIYVAWSLARDHT